MNKDARRNLGEQGSLPAPSFTRIFRLYDFIESSFANNR